MTFEEETNKILDELGYPQNHHGIPNTLEELIDFRKEVELRLKKKFLHAIELATHPTAKRSTGTIVITEELIKELDSI